MQKPTTRRAFLQQCLLTGGAAAGLGILSPQPSRGIEPFRRPGAPRLRLSLAAYSFRDLLKHKDPAKRMTLFDFVDFCAEQGLEGAELTSYYFPDPPDRDYLLQLRRHAFLRGVTVSGSAVGNNFVVAPGPARDKQIADVKRWVDHCSVLGAPHIRVFAGPTSPGLDLPTSKRLVVEALEECAQYAGSRGIFLGLENHHGIVADPEDLLDIVRAVKSPWLGINLDTGNFYTDDPYADLAKCVPYAVNVQVKVDIRRRTDPKPSPADFKRLAGILRSANYQGWVALEYEAAEDPRAAVPRYLRELRAALEAR